MRVKRFPPGWDEERVRKVLAHYEEQTDAEAVAEDEAAFEEPTQTVIEVPTALVPVIRESPSITLRRLDRTATKAEPPTAAAGGTAALRSYSAPSAVDGVRPPPLSVERVCRACGHAWG